MYTTPRGHENKKWSEIAGCYDPVSKIVYAGAGSDPDGSLILHELGHGVADLFDLNNSSELVNTHVRLFDKLEDYYQQGGPGGVAGCEELFAEAFSLYLIASEEGFLLRYKDMNFYNFFAKKFPKT